MSKISIVYDQFLTKLNELFPAGVGNAYSRIPNPYSIEDNPEILLRKSWGLRLDGASPRALQEFNTYSQIHDFTVVLTAELIKTDSQSDGFDAKIKELAEVTNTLRDNMLDDNQLGIESSIEEIRFPNVSPVGFIQGEKSDFVFIEITFPVVITEKFSIKP